MINVAIIGRLLDLVSLGALFAAVGSLFGWTSLATGHAIDLKPIFGPDWRHLGIHAIAGLLGTLAMVMNTKTGKTTLGLLSLFLSGAIIGGLIGPAVTEVSGLPYLGFGVAGALGYSVLNFFANPTGTVKQILDMFRGKGEGTDGTPPPGPPAP